MFWSLELMKNHVLTAFAACLIATAPLYYAFQLDTGADTAGVIQAFPAIEPAAAE